MNKKIAIIALALCMVAAIAVTGTIAYFTDTDKADNVFVVGNLNIEMFENERVVDENGDKTTTTRPFTQNQHLYPIFGSAQGEKDDLNMPLAKNYIDKMVTVTNYGSEPAWVRSYFAIPSALDDGYDTFNAGLNVLHFNFGANGGTDGKQGTLQKEWLWKRENGKWNYFETTMDNIKYNVYFADYYQPLGSNASTVRLIDGLYLDASFNYDPVTNKYEAFEKTLTLDEKWDWNNVKCPVFTVAVQAAGFDTADEAIKQAFGDQYNPWDTPVENWNPEY